jgi:hypothetical protein
MAFLATINSMCMGTVTAARHRGLAIDGGAAGVEVRRHGQLYSSSSGRTLSLAELG